MAGRRGSGARGDDVTGRAEPRGAVEAWASGPGPELRESWLPGEAEVERLMAFSGGVGFPAAGAQSLCARFSPEPLGE